MTEPAYTVAPVSGMRRAMAARMRLSNSEIPQVTLQAEAEADGLVTAAESSGGSISVTVHMLRIVSEALLAHPAINSWMLDGEWRQFSTVNLGVAVASRHGLVVPVLRDVTAMTLPQIADRLKALRQAADDRKLRTVDVSDGTFTVTNLGMYGVGHFNPLVNPPQVAILGVGAVTIRPAKTAEGRWLPLSLTFNHAAVDGAEAATFLRDLCRRIGQAQAAEHESGVVRQS